MEKKLSPLSLQQIVEQSLVIYMNNLVPFIGLTAFITIPITLMSLLVLSSLETQIVFDATTNAGFNPQLPSGIWLVFLIAILNVFLQGVITSGLITQMTSESYLKGGTTLLQAVAAVQGRLLNLALALGGLLLAFIAGLIVLSIAVICIFPIFAIPVLIYLGIAVYFFVVPIMILENVDVRLGLNRALGLGKARFWPALSLVVGVNVITTIISQVLVTFGQTLTGIDANNDFAYTMLNAIVQIIFSPLLPITLTLMYFDTRVRFENFAEAVEATAPEQPADIPSEPVIHSANRILNGQDLTNIVMFTALLFAMAVVFGPLFGLLFGIPPA